MARLIIFDDGRGRLGPMCDLRASFELRTGMLTSAARLTHCWPKTLAGYWVPEHLRTLVATRANAPVNVLPNDEQLFCVNGRWATPDTDLDLPVGCAAIEETTDHIVAAHLRHADAEYFLTTGELHERVEVRRLRQRVLYRFPWDVLDLLPQTLTHDILNIRMLDVRVPGRESELIGPHPVEIHETASIWPYVVFDATQGPIAVMEKAIIRPGAVICGPCAIGHDATVLDHAIVKPNTSIGPVCKVGGEIGGTILQGYSNKSHDGHLGDSWVGKWVNFGAGTTNSNLLNTYGEVTMRLEPDGQRHRTGRRYLGAIVGDHVKTAIGTRLMTGTVIGTGAMIAGSEPPPATVRRFAWITDEGERVYQYDRFVEVMTTMMARRGKTPKTAYLDLLRDVYDRAAATRKT